MVVLRVLLMVVAFGALAVLGWHIRQRLRTISLRRSSSGGHPYLELLKEPNGWLLGFFAPIGLLVLITAGFVLPTAVTVVAFVFTLVVAAALSTRLSQPSGPVGGDSEQLERIRDSLDQIVGALREGGRRAPSEGHTALSHPPSQVHGDVHVSASLSGVESRFDDVGRKLDSLESTLETGFRDATSGIGGIEPKSIAIPMFFFVCIPMVFMTYAVSDFRSHDRYNENVLRCMQERHPAFGLLPQRQVAKLMTLGQEQKIVRDAILQLLSEAAAEGTKKGAVASAAEDLEVAWKYSKYGMARFLFSLWVDAFGCEPSKKSKKEGGG